MFIKRNLYTPTGRKKIGNQNLLVQKATGYSLICYLFKIIHPNTTSIESLSLQHENLHPKEQ